MRWLRRKFRDLKNLKKRYIVLIVIVVLLAFFIIWGIVALNRIQKDAVDIVERDKVDPKAKEVLIVREEKKHDDVMNVLLVGTDTRDPNAELGRSDSMMLVSYNKDKNKATLVSFQRDSLVEIEGYGLSKLGHTYAYGGVGLTINTINQVYDLDIQNYITINFENLVGIIDELGGIEVPFTPEEAEYYRVNGMPDAVEGVNLLTGSQALAHARNRTLDNDFGRTRRQRSVMNGIYRKIISSKDPTTILPLINYCMTQVQTNLKVNEIYDLAKEVLSSSNLTIQQTSVPAEGTYTFGEYEGMSVINLDIEANKENLERFLY